VRASANHSVFVPYDACNLGDPALLGMSSALCLYRFEPRAGVPCIRHSRRTWRVGTLKAPTASAKWGLFEACATPLLSGV